MTLLKIGSKQDGKIIVLKKEINLIPKIREFTRELGITRDYRKHVFADGKFYNDQWYAIDNKDGSIKFTIFVGQEKIVIRVQYPDNKKEEIGKLIEDCLT